MADFVQGVPQIVPEEWCLRCRICCRFPAEDKVQAPAWSQDEANRAVRASGSSEWFEPDRRTGSLQVHLVPCAGGGYRCPAFEPETHRCSIHSAKPLDCRLYPFILTRSPDGECVVLSVDTKCPFIQARGGEPDVTSYAVDLAGYLQSPAAEAYLQTNPGIIGEKWPEYLVVASLTFLAAPAASPGKCRASARPSLSLPSTALAANASPPHPALEPLDWEGAEVLRGLLAARAHAWSGYALAALWGWRDRIPLWWMRIPGGAAVFAGQGDGWYMPLPPLVTERESLRSHWKEVWAILQEANRGAGVSRVEGIEPSDLNAWREAGFSVQPSEPEYLYRRSDLAALQGDRYRSQRWAVNRFRRRFQGQIRPFEEEDIVPCLKAYTQWAIRRQQQIPEGHAKGLIRDSLFFHRRLMMDCRRLGLTGWVAQVDGRIRGYTLGAPVSPRVFCILVEIADRSLPGLGAWLFREFCSRLEPYEFVNAMGDEGLAGLRQAKSAYRPMGRVFTGVATQG